MTEQTGRPSVEGFDPYAEHDDASAVAATQDDGPRGEGGGDLPASATEAIDRATAALGDDDGAHR